MPLRAAVDKKQRQLQKAMRAPVTIVVAIAAALLILFLYTANGDLLLRFVAAIFVLMISGQMIANANGIKSSYGAYMLGGKAGIALIESLSKKNRRFWTFMTDWGLAFSFGLLSYFLFKRQVTAKVLISGLVTILAVLFFIYPYLPLILNFISVPQLSSVVANAAAGQQGVNLLFYLFLVASIIGGFSVSTILLILLSGGTIVYTTFLFLLSLLSSSPNPSLLSNQAPGVAPIIPGLTIPLVPGIIALFILLVVHEFSHGVLARISKVRIKSIGAILFGIVPLGAFVEPVESQVNKLSSKEQNRISIAGISANMITSLVFFALTFLMLYYVLPGISTQGVRITAVVANSPAYNASIPANSVVVAWNNHTISNAYDLGHAESGFTPGTQVRVTTNAGIFLLTPTSQGKIGIYYAPAMTTLSYSVANFVYAVAVLSFALNFFVAIFNLLPIPAFDGWRIYQNKVKSKKLLKTIAAILVAAILVNVLPWFWIVH